MFNADENIGGLFFVISKSKLEGPLRDSKDRLVDGKLETFMIDLFKSKICIFLEISAFFMQMLHIILCIIPLK